MPRLPLASTTIPSFGNDEDDIEDEVIDLSEVEETTYQPLPPGVYDAEVEDAQFQMSKNSNKPMIVWRFITEVEGSDGNPTNRKLYLNSSLQTDQLGRVKRIVTTLDPDFDLRHFRPRTVAEDFGGKSCRLRVTVKRYEGRLVNQVNEVLPASEASRAFLPNR